MITRKSLHRRTLRAVALVSVACLFGTGTALAAGPSEVHLKVKYSDLNLSTMNGATTLYQRIEGAAHFVCGDEGRSLDEQIVWKTCYGNAVNHAVTQVNNPLLTSLYAKQYHPAPVRTAMLGR
jgi:UrcA family protein